MEHREGEGTGGGGWRGDGGGMDVAAMEPMERIVRGECCSRRTLGCVGTLATRSPLHVGRAPYQGNPINERPRLHELLPTRTLHGHRVCHVQHQATGNERVWPARHTPTRQEAPVGRGLGSGAPLSGGGRRMHPGARALPGPAPPPRIASGGAASEAPRLTARLGVCLRSSPPLAGDCSSRPPYWWATVAF